MKRTDIVWTTVGGVAVGLEVRGSTICELIRRTFRTDTPTGRAVFVGSWAAFSVWFIGHILGVRR